MEKLKLIIPVAGAAAVIAAVSYSLGSYHAPVYNPEDYAIQINTDNEEGSGDTQNSAPLLAKEKEISADTANNTIAAGDERLAFAGDISGLSSAPEGSVLKDGVYRGSAAGFKGTTVVDVTVTDGKIAQINLISSEDDPEYLNRALSVLDAIKTTQNTSVDTVSGATFSSAGLINAVADALGKAYVSGSDASAGEAVSLQTQNPAANTQNNLTNLSSAAAPAAEPPVSSSAYKDGLYRGSADGFNGAIEVEVSISNNKITGIDVISSNDDPEFFNSALRVLEDIKSAQSTSVDTVSGATYSSVGLINACNAALKKAIDSSVYSVNIADASYQITNTGKYIGGSIGISLSGSSKKISDTDNTTPMENIKSFVSFPDDTVSYKDGTYHVRAYCNKDYEDDRFDEYILGMDITLKDNKIIAIDNILSEDGDKTNERFIEKAAKIILPSVLSSGTPYDTDTVSGATYSSDSILRACANVFLLADESREEESNIMPF